MLLKTLSEAFGPTGFEDDVRNVIRGELDGRVDEMNTDVLGNLIAVKGAKKPGPKVMLDAHMDEVGLMIVQICDGGAESGLLKFRALGGIDPRVLVSKPVLIGPDRIPGVIGAKPVHLQAPEERQKPIPMDKLYIDIGAKDAADAKAVVKPGDAAVFATRYAEFGDRAAKGKSFDDRVGCALLVEAMQTEVPYPLYGAFTVQEEIGLRGARAAAYQIQPDIAIALEGTVCFDVVGAPSHGQSTVFGKGPALTVQDAQTIADRRFAEFMWETAKRHGIPVQWRRVKGGSNDFGAIHRVGKGIVGGSISVPVRYIHAPTQVVSLDDVENAGRLLRAVLQEIAEGSFTL
ncbi:endoglucanase [Alicyclobacillus sacchari]|uniref:Endoglucanase n=1 Tax=Alicyclobacillus sacchari TaxID=392010 RepID=A0A4R8LVM6_9BACL|nr:M42 family metallopeptidase [Alicyclobacillus sacchari]TDY50726.1 endoglucanase [Alicyclobacillus sacchari]GMA55715.1 aminopeptidase [Alicyclobacillus sacchari]